MKVKFTKMQGAGNDYIYVNTFLYPLEEPERQSVGRPADVKIIVNPAA